MRTPNDNRKGSLSRREFTRKSILAVAGIGTAGLAGYGILNRTKLKSVNNMLSMGHCAPSVMKTILSINGLRNDNMVLYAGAMAGGIAGPEMECGALTAPLMFLGFKNNNLNSISAKLDLIKKAQSYLNEFTVFNGTPICSKIRSEGMDACRRTVYNFNKPFKKAISNPAEIEEEAAGSYSFLLNAFDEHKFHCADAVYYKLENDFNITDELISSSWLFIGGIALLNRTCGALAAGVLALSSKAAKMENSYSRVARMNRLLRDGNNTAMNEDINNFNRSISLGEELGRWFRGEFGSNSCSDIWHYDFSRIKDTQNFISGQCIKQCDSIAKKVAEKVNNMI